MIFLNVMSDFLYMKHLHILLYTSTFLSFYELILVSFSDQFTQIFLFFEACVKLSFKCFFILSISIMLIDFSIKCALATDLTEIDKNLDQYMHSVICFTVILILMQMKFFFFQLFFVT